jgi:hypothetical protein
MVEDHVDAGPSPAERTQQFLPGWVDGIAACPSDRRPLALGMGVPPGSAPGEGSM